MNIRHWLLKFAIGQTAVLIEDTILNSTLSWFWITPTAMVSDFKIGDCIGLVIDKKAQSTHDWCKDLEGFPSNYVGI